MSAPTAFISYSYDDAQHRMWVTDLAVRLRSDGVDVTLDKWALAIGDQLPQFMETAVRQNDYVLVVCTPRYKARSDSRVGGVGYEGDVMTAEVMVYGNRRKFLPILARGEWSESAPSWLLGSRYVDLRHKDDPSHYAELLHALHSVPPEIPALGIAWAIEASKAAQYLHNHHSPAHRGAILWFSNVTAIFGNDGYSGAPDDNERALAAMQRAKQEVEGIRSELHRLGIQELGFGTCRSGYTWVILVRSADVNSLNASVWKHYPEGGSNNAIQRKEAFSQLWTFWSTPFNDQAVVFPDHSRQNAS